MGFFPLLAGLIAVPALAGASVLPRAAAQYPTVNTTHGYIRGTGSEYRNGVTVYKGIPFAAPPTGSRRWKAPSAPEPWTDVLEATEFGPQCAQTYSSAGIFSTGKNTTSEDCLYLNVWHPTYNDTTDLASKKLPVYVWIYGGRFSGGSADVKTYDGSGLASKDIVVVTLNYRLGSFGFLAHPDLSAESGAHNSSGNYGILDQQFALRWVQDNIANFGGNPDQVTVGGQSAGSASALDMMWSPLSKGLIHGVIAESGARGPHDPITGSAATSYRTKDAAEAAGVEFLKTMNVSSIEELRNVSTEALIEQGNENDSTFVGTAFENVTRLSGSAVDDRLFRKLIFLAWRFAPIVEGFKNIQAYHAGDGVWVEVDILLDSRTPLMRSHDIAETLQYCLEGLPEVDRAFVTTDYAESGPTGHSSNQC